MLPDASPPLLAPASPPRGVDGTPRKPGVGQERVSPRLPTSPSFAGFAGRAVRRVENCPTSLLPARDPFSCAARSWASVVRDGVVARLPPSVNRSDFLALYERCVHAGLRACISIWHQAGSQDITISCRIITLPQTPTLQPMGAVAAAAGDEPKPAQPSLRKRLGLTLCQTSRHLQERRNLQWRQLPLPQPPPLRLQN
jgi:hypothetical protein